MFIDFRKRKGGVRGCGGERERDILQPEWGSNLQPFGVNGHFNQLSHQARAQFVLPSFYVYFFIF